VPLTPGRFHARKAPAHLVILAAALLSAPGTTVAQEPVAAQQVLRSALGAIRERLPGGAVLVISSTHPHFTDPDGPARARALAQAVGIRVAEHSQVRRCRERTPPSCRLLGADALVWFDPPRISGDTATVEVELWRQTDSERQPVSRESLLVSLARKQGVWQVTKVQLLEIS